MPVYFSVCSFESVVRIRLYIGCLISMIVALNEYFIRALILSVDEEGRPPSQSREELLRVSAGSRVKHSR